jgi:hypothetical protein
MRLPVRFRGYLEHAALDVTCSLAVLGVNVTPAVTAFRKSTDYFYAGAGQRSKLVQSKY